MTEPQAGSDVKSLKTTAKRDGDEWVLNGTKVFITNGGIADVHVVVATVDPALGTRGQASFVIGKDTPGLSQGKKESKLGIRASHTAEIVLEDCRIPVENLLGGEEKLEKKLQRGREGKKSRGADALATFEMTRPLVGASALGIAQAAYEWTLEYLDGQSEGGTPLLQTQRIQQTLADVATEIEAARLLVQRAAWMGRNGIPMTGGQGSMSKLKAGDVTMWATTTLMDLVGPYAWNTECPLEKWFRDAKIYQLFEGTAEIQRMVISRMQAREYAERLGYARRSRRRRRWPAKEPVPPRPGAAGPSRRFAGRPTAPAALSSGRARPRPLARAGRAARGQPAADVDRAGDQRRRCCVAEAVGGVLTGSLAVLADAGHLLSDVGSIVLALIAARAGRRCRRRGGAPSATSARRCWRRWSTGCCWSRSASSIAIAAIGRFSDPPAIDGGGVLGARPLRPRRQRRRDRRPRPRRARGHQPRGRAAPLASPTRSARSASSSPAPSSCRRLRRSSTRSSAC